MSTTLTLKQTVASVWQKFMEIVGHKSIKGIGDDTLTGAIVELNSNLNPSFEKLNNVLTIERCGKKRIIHIAGDVSVLNGYVLPEKDRHSLPVDVLGACMRTVGNAFVTNGIMGVRPDGTLFVWVASVYNNKDSGLEDTYYGTFYGEISYYVA